MKKILFAAFAAATIGLAGYNVIESIQTAELSDLALKNIEALAELEGNDCHYSNGVNNIQLQPSFWHKTLHRYYDCCAVQIDGYDYDGECS